MLSYINNYYFVYACMKIREWPVYRAVAPCAGIRPYSAGPSLRSPAYIRRVYKSRDRILSTTGRDQPAIIMAIYLAAIYAPRPYSGL